MLYPGQTKHKPVHLVKISGLKNNKPEHMENLLKDPRNFDL